MVEVEGFCFANQCSDILDEFDAQDLDLDEVGVCDWSYSVLCSQCKWRWTDIIVSSPECKLISHTIVVSLFFISFVRKSVLEFKILNLFFGLLEKYEARIKNQNFFTWMKVYNS